MDITSDEALTILARIPRDERKAQLKTLSLRLLRQMADLCGVDSVDMTKNQAIAAILENF